MNANKFFNFINELLFTCVSSISIGRRVDSYRPQDSF